MNLQKIDIADFTTFHMSYNQVFFPGLLIILSTLIIGITIMPNIYTENAVCEVRFKYIAQRTYPEYRCVVFAQLYIPRRRTMLLAAV